MLKTDKQKNKNSYFPGSEWYHDIRNMDNHRNTYQRHNCADLRCKDVSG